MKKISLVIDDNVFRLLKKRAKENLMSVQELIEDIIRRSMVSYQGGKRRAFKIDDRLVAIFSRERRGRKKKTKKLKKSKK